MSSSSPAIIDRIVAAVSYMTAGIAGIVWLLVCALRKNMPDRFLMFHIKQSVFVSLCYIALNFLFNVFIKILEFIPFVNRLVRQIVYLFNMPLLAGYSVMQIIIYGIFLYLVVSAALGYYSYLPYITKFIKDKN